ELADLLPIARPGVSRHLRVLRTAGLVTVDTDAQFRIYSLDPAQLTTLDEWLRARSEQWAQRLGALHTEIARGKRDSVSTRHIESKEAS
ncbi:ArsR/SmtB family transcription factor, partial [Arthrobacter rhombi]|uniref:ArsR/SmtB family transcription factor n=2 Tax=Arthrobacter TaxID=1663 RepID=UPI003FD40B3A